MASMFVVLLRAEEEEMERSANSFSSKGVENLAKGVENLAKIACTKSFNSIGKDSCPNIDSGTEESPDDSAEHNEKAISKKKDKVRVLSISEDTTPLNPQDHSGETRSKEPREKTTSDIEREASSMRMVEMNNQSGKKERKTSATLVELTEEEKDKDEHEKEGMTIFMKREPVSDQICIMLKDFSVKNACVQKSFDEKFIMVTFVADNEVVEAIILKLKSLGIGSTSGTSMSVLPASIHIMEEDEEETEEMEFGSEFSFEKESSFKKSIKSRLVVHQVVSSVRANAQFTFDYLLLIILASSIAAVGLVENSSVVLVASMLISPLMGPILASTFGQVIKNSDLRNLAIRSELIGLLICLCIGFLFGFISGGVGLHGAVWGSTDQWPTSEMQSRGMLRSLWVGALIAIPSGAGVAISVLGGNAGSLVGVAISASLLPPAVNAGMLWAFSILAASREWPLNVTTTTPPVNNTTQHSVSNFASEQCLSLSRNAYKPIYSCNMAHEAAILGLVSLCLTIVNIICIFIMGVVVLKIKEVAPHTADTETTKAFWKEDITVAREYYATRKKGATSTNLGQQFLNEWKKKEQKEPSVRRQSSPLSKEIQDPVSTLYFYKMMKDMEESLSVKQMLSELNAATPQPITSGLKEDCRRAQKKLDEQIGQQENYTEHSSLQHNQLRLLKKARSVYLEDNSLPILESEMLLDRNGTAWNPVMKLNLDDSKLLHRRKKDKKIRFQVTKVNESSAKSTGSPLLDETKL